MTDIAQPQMRPLRNRPRADGHGRRISRSLAVKRDTALRFLSFMVLCFLHAIARRRVRAIMESEHGMPATKFFRLALRRYRQGHGKSTRFSRPTYLTQQGRQFNAARCARKLRRAPSAGARLFLAGALKAQGFFYDAEFIYRSLATDSALRPVVRGLALAGLGDLLLLQATWAREIAIYEAEDIVINPFAQLSRYRGSTTWQKRRMSEARETLLQAVSLSPRCTDAWRLLACTYVEEAMWREALDALERFSAQVPYHPEQSFLRAEALFGAGNPAGRTVFEFGLGDNLSYLHIDEAKMAFARDLTGQGGISSRETWPGATLTTHSRLVSGGEVSAIRGQLRFEPAYLNSFESAEVLPLFGAILANGKFLIEDSLHHKRCHATLFTPAIKMLAGNQALLSRPAAAAFPEPDCIFIGYNHNYYHWLMDELPRLLHAQDDPACADAPVLVNVQAREWQRELLRRVGIDDSRFRPVDFSGPVRFKRLIAPSYLSKNMVAHPDAVRFMRHRLAPHADGMSPKPGKRLYLARSAASIRQSQFLNERHIMETFRKAGFSLVDPGAMTIDEQIEVFSDAEVIAGPGGAAVANVLFAPKSAKVVTLSPMNALCETFSSVCNAIGQEYVYCAGASYPRSYMMWVWTTFDFEISDRDIRLCLDQVL